MGRQNEQKPARRARPDVASLLQVLREQTDQSGDRTRFRVTGAVQRISDSVAALSDLPRAQPDTVSLLQALRQQTDQLASQVRFHDVGTVRHVGDGVQRAGRECSRREA